MTSGQPENWIARTGQRTKALVTLGISCLAPAAAVLAFSFGAVLMAVGLLVLAVLSRPSSRWLSDLFALEECPSCDDRGGSAS